MISYTDSWPLQIFTQESPAKLSACRTKAIQFIPCASQSCKSLRPGLSKSLSPIRDRTPSFNKETDSLFQEISLKNSMYQQVVSSIGNFIQEVSKENHYNFKEWTS